MEVTLSSKGQITLPKAMRDTMHLKKGDKLIFEETPDGSYAMKPRMVDVRSLKGCIAYSGKTVSVEEMNQAIAEHVADDGQC